MGLDENSYFTENTNSDSKIISLSFKNYLKESNLYLVFFYIFNMTYIPIIELF